ncbi:MAG: DNA replication and repair protein RecF [Chlorobium sp.]|nr:MAG: DNA replication and repair protein RecF [Chlorobium sp.]
MRLKRLYYENFRNHRFATFEPAEGITLVYGENGSGKTSLLEGIHYCALTRGFISASDRDCLSFLSDFFLLDSNFISDTEAPINVKVIYTKEKEKQIVVNNGDVKPFSTHIGQIPCITFSPPEMVIVNGAPSERRRFIDTAISQINRRYLEELLAYRRVLNQRNAILVQLHDHHTVHKEMLSLWTENISRLSAAIVYKRVHFLSLFFECFKAVYEQLSVREDPDIIYHTSIGKITPDISQDMLYGLFLSRYEQTERQEIFRAQTLSGPHRDDLLFLLNNREIKKYASQGQLRTFLIGLKLSQHRFFYDTLGEKPVCLLDDIFSELDSSRIGDIFTILESCGQTIITSAEKRAHGAVTAIPVDSLHHLKKR